MDPDDNNLELRQHIAWIDRELAETRKLIAEAKKYDKERWWYPWLPLITSTAAATAFGFVIARLFHG